jgi:hypothetical protein
MPNLFVCLKLAVKKDKCDTWQSVVSVAFNLHRNPKATGQNPLPLTPLWPGGLDSPSPFSRPSLVSCQFAFHPYRSYIQDAPRLLFFK